MPDTFSLDVALSVTLQTVSVPVPVPVSVPVPVPVPVSVSVVGLSLCSCVSACVPPPELDPPLNFWGCLGLSRCLIITVCRRFGCQTMSASHSALTAAL
jgi:hypothetical protein